MRLVLVAAVACAACSASPPPIPPGACDPGGTLNPSGEFANTLIRAHPPDSLFPNDSGIALQRAWEEGYPYIEIDVRPSADGVFWPARHDSLDDFSDCTGSLAATTSAELHLCNYDRDGLPTPALSMEDVLPGTGFRGIYLDLKSTATAPLSTPEQIVTAIQRLAALVDLPDALVGMSYDATVAEAILAAGLRAGLKGYPADTAGADALIMGAAAIGGEMVCVRNTLLPLASYQLAESLGVWLLPWAATTDLDDVAMATIVTGRAGGLITGDPSLVDALHAEVCDAP